MPDYFFDEFVKELNNVNDNILKFRVNPILDTFIGSINSKLKVRKLRIVWSPLPKYRKIKFTKYLAIAIDGGIKSLELSNGEEIVISRAIAINNFNKKPIKEVLVKVLPVPSSDVKKALLTIAEMKVAKKAIEEYFQDNSTEDLKVVLIDGSLYARLIAIIHELILTRSFLDLYYIPEIILALNQIVELLEACRELNVMPIFISKNTNIKIFKDSLVYGTLKELILESSSNVDPSIIELLTKGEEWYSISWIREFRRKLLDFIRIYNGPHREVVKQGIKIALSQSITDIDFLEKIANIENVSVGITRRLLIGLIDAYLNSRGLTSVDNVINEIRDRIEDSINLRSVDDVEIGSVSKYVELVKEALQKLPRIILFYIKLSTSDTPLMIEIPYYEWNFFDLRIPAKVFFDNYVIEDIVELLIENYIDKVHYNKLLWIAHQYVTFSEKELVEYALTILKKFSVRYKRSFSIAVGLP